MGPSQSSPNRSPSELVLLETLDAMRRTAGRMVSMATRAFLQRDDDVTQQVKVKDGYLDNLHSQAQLLAHDVDRAGNARLARCGWTMASNLEHIGDLSVNVARQHRHRLNVAEPETPHTLRDYRHAVLKGLTLAMHALEHESATEAYAACRIEEKLDGLYAADLDALGDTMQEGGEAAREALTWTFVKKNYERMGDEVQNLGEAVLSLLFGERMKLDHVRTMDRLVPVDTARPRGVWGGVSGAMVALVEREGEVCVYKGGPREKILREAERLAEWEEKAPGLPPAVLAPVVEDEPAGLLMEYIAGPTLEDVVLRQDTGLRTGLEALFATLEPLWERTRIRGDEPPRFVAQIRARLRELYDIHPQLARLRARAVCFGPLRFAPLEELLVAAEERELALRAPDKVFLHGDLNLSNLIVTNDPGRPIRVVDVYRSGYGDLAQDISVLMVSCRRHPLSYGEQAGRARWFYDAVRARAVTVARQNGDLQFEERLRLGLARSYITSGRVIRDRQLARALFLKGVWYLEEFVGVRHGRGDRPCGGPHA